MPALAADSTAQTSHPSPSQPFITVESWSFVESEDSEQCPPRQEGTDEAKVVMTLAGQVRDAARSLNVTHATMMTIQHGFKVIAFGFLGFAFGPYVPLLAGLLICGFVGTWAGKHMLNALPEKAFRIGLKAVITLLALKILYSGLSKTFS